MHCPDLTRSVRNPFLPCWLAPGGCGTARSPWRVPNSALDEPSSGCGVMEQSWQEKLVWSSLHNPQTHLPEPTCLHWFPLVTCLSCLEFSPFFFLLQGSQVFLFLPWEKQVSIFRPCGIQAHDSPSTPCMKNESRSLCATGTSHLLPWSAWTTEWLSPTRVLTLGR